MKNFVFKSKGTSDLQKMFQYIETRLDVMNKNVLYCTHHLDKLVFELNRQKHDESLQKQVDEYFEDDAEQKAEQV